jgi:hypothetical protein
MSFPLKLNATENSVHEILDKYLTKIFIHVKNSNIETNNKFKLHYDGLYATEMQNDSNFILLRFYEDGTVLLVILDFVDASVSTRQIMTWFKKERTDKNFFKGKYKINGNAITIVFKKEFTTYKIHRTGYNVKIHENGVSLINKDLIKCYMDYNTGFSKKYSSNLCGLSEKEYKFRKKSYVFIKRKHKINGYILDYINIIILPVLFVSLVIFIFIWNSIIESISGKFKINDISIKGIRWWCLLNMTLYWSSVSIAFSSINHFFTSIIILFFASGAYVATLKDWNERPWWSLSKWPMYITVFSIILFGGLLIYFISTNNENLGMFGMTFVTLGYAVVSFVSISIIWALLYVEINLSFITIGMCTAITVANYKENNNVDILIYARELFNTLVGGLSGEMFAIIFTSALIIKSVVTIIEMFYLRKQ